METLVDFHTDQSVASIWSAVHQAWPVYLAELLQPALPSGYDALPGVMYRREGDAVVLRSEHAWSEPQSPTEAVPNRVLSIESSQTFSEVLITRDDDQLAGLIEIISPSNLDRPHSRAAICGKVEAAFQDRVGVAWIDTVNTYTTNLHRLLLQSLGEPDPEADRIYAASYAKAVRHDELAIWYAPLAIGQPVRDVPLVLKGGASVNVPFAASYALLWERLSIKRVLADAARESLPPSP